MIIDKDLEKEIRSNLQDNEIVHCINIIFEYLTPYGILVNNLDVKKLSHIFKKSLKEKENKYYSNKFHDFFLSKTKNSGVKNTIVQFVHFHDVHMMDGGDSTNLYLIENFGTNKLNVSRKYVEAMQTTPIWYFLIIDNGNSIINDETIEDFKKFRIQNKISKERVLFISKNKPYRNTEWTYLNFDIFNSNTISYIGKELNTIYNKYLV